MAKKQELSYDTKVILTVLLLLAVYPIGVLVMWKWGLWSKVLRHVITLPIYLMVLLIVLAIVLLVVGTVLNGAR